MKSPIKPGKKERQDNSIMAKEKAGRIPYSQNPGNASENSDSLRAV